MSAQPQAVINQAADLVIREHFAWGGRRQPAEPQMPLDCAIARVIGPVIRGADQMEIEATRQRHVASEGVRIAREAAGRMSLDDAAEAIGLAMRIVEEIE